MKQIKQHFFIIVAMLCLCSCSNYDWDKPDTQANRNGFSRILTITPDKNVTNVYFFADEWGGDASYWFAFSSPQEVISKIIEKWHLTLVKERSDSFSPPVSTPLTWWNLEERKQSQYYEYRDTEKKVDCYLWYNPETKKCQIAIVYW